MYGIGAATRAAKADACKNTSCKSRPEPGVGNATRGSRSRAKAINAGQSTMNGPIPTEASMTRGVVCEMLAEFLGTFVLSVFGVGVVAQTILSKWTAGSTLSINIAWGLAVTMGCYFLV